MQPSQFLFAMQPILSRAASSLARPSSRPSTHVSALATRGALTALSHAALLALGAVPVAALAQSSSSPLDRVVVTGTREAQPLSKSVADIVLIDAETLRDGGADTVEEALRRYAGLQITRNGGPGQSAGYLIRGNNASGAIVLVDGVRVGSATLAQTAFEAMSLAQIDHIEVLRGPASGLYGADAVGGVIQIFTKKGQGPLSVTGHAAVGGNNSRQADFGVSGAQAGFDYAASVGRETSEGVSAIRPHDANGYYNPDRDGFGRTTAAARLGFTPAEGHRIGLSATQSRLNAQYDSADFDANFNADPSPDFRNRLKTRSIAADYRGTLSPIWTTSAQVARNTDDSLSGGGFPSRYKTDRDQVTWQNALRVGAGQQVVLAYEHLSEKVRADVFPSAPKRTNNAYIAGYTGEFGPIALEGSLRRDDNSAYGGNTTGNLGASYALTSELKVRALAGKTFRAPSFNDLYFPQYGIPTIRPERGRSIELGLNWTSGASSASATVYRNKVRDQIAYNPDPMGTDCPKGYFGCAGNVGRAKMTGATLTGSHRVGNLSLNATVDFLDAQDELKRTRLLRRAAHQESVSADYDTGTWSVGATLTDVGARPDVGGNLGAYAVLDLRASWKFLPQWRLEAKMLNVADRDVQPVRDYQGLGRQAWFGIRYDMKGL
ncbi:TonB-dependent receptor domain-containing protein [Roseateles chitosanitabidus]|uniref:TonB-dependent receptor domain-containing protein n=1 Tax=Roseateles chitosanitabidus TaxID=65048 RepID=UPI00082B0E4B|nr:TonB-dependent receptor [Roseateles chitosanitabidus]